jgi:hypothetical protein
VLSILISHLSSSIILDLSNELDGGSWNEILTSKFFGNNDPITGKIVDGRWANVEIPRMTSDFMVKEGIDENSTFFPTEETAW